MPQGVLFTQNLWQPVVPPTYRIPLEKMIATNQNNQGYRIRPWKIVRQKTKGDKAIWFRASKALSTGSLPSFCTMIQEKKLWRLCPELLLIVLSFCQITTSLSIGYHNNINLSLPPSFRSLLRVNLGRWSWYSYYLVKLLIQGLMFPILDDLLRLEKKNCFKFEILSPYDIPENCRTFPLKSRIKT